VYLALAELARVAAEAAAAELTELFVVGNMVPFADTILLRLLFVPTPILFSWSSRVSNLFFFTTPFHVLDESFFIF
jgi:hypothetical protein